jgi:hypothetical protein
VVVGHDEDNVWTLIARTLGKRGDWTERDGE